MFDFIRKSQLWEALDLDSLKEIESHKISFQLKTAQDLIIYSYLKNLINLKIAEIGGGDSRI